jgi:hypothetical protein
MHKKYAKDGLVAISVTLDDPDSKEDRANALDFLQKADATQQNFLLNEAPEVWQEKLKITGPPCVYVFNRDNQWVKKLEGFKDSGDHEAIEKLVVELLKQ